MKQRFETRRMVLLAMFVAIELILGFVPNLGYIKTPWGMQITLLHIPVILCGVVLGPRAGAFSGFVFGLTSLISATLLTPNPVVSPLFTPFYASPVMPSSWWSLAICFVPRILVGVVAALVFRGLGHILSLQSAAMLISGILGSITNTVLVLLGIYVFFGEAYSAAAGIRPMDILASIVGVNGLLEAGVAAILTAAIGIPLLKTVK